MRARMGWIPRVFSVGVVVSVLVLAGVIPVCHAEVALDPGFGVGGVVSTDFSGEDEYGRGCRVASGDRIILAGYASGGVADTLDFAVVRYTEGGDLDTSFGTGGVVSTDFFEGPDKAYGCDLDSAGRIVVAGSAENTGGVVTHNLEFALAVYEVDGNLSGKVTTDFAGREDEAHACVVDSEDRIVIAGKAGLTGSEVNFGVARFTTGLGLDTDFNGTGKETTDFGGTEEAAWGTAVDGQGRVVVVGYTSNFTGPSRNFAVVCYDSEGNLDSTFDSDGLLSLDFGEGENDYATSVAIDSDDRIVVAGAVATDGGDYDLIVARFNEDGSLDATFNSTGWVVTDVDGESDIAEACVLDSEGRIVVAGRTGASSNYDCVLARYTPGGVLDETFHEGGLLVSDLTGRHDYVRSCAIDSQGRIIVGGWAGGSNNDFLVARFLAGDGPVVPQYLISCDWGAGGTVSPASAEVPEGGDRVFSILPEEGYCISEVLVDGQPYSYDEVANTITLSDVSASHDIEVTFELCEELSPLTSSGGCSLAFLSGTAVLVLPLLCLLIRVK